MGIIIAVVILSLVLVVGPINAVFKTIAAGGAGLLVAFIAFAFCVPLIYAWVSLLWNDGYGDGWRELSLFVIGLGAALVGTIISGFAVRLAEPKR